MFYFLVSIVFAYKFAFSAVIDRPESSPKGWTEESRSKSTKKISLAFAIKNQNLDQLEDILLAVSTPGNPQYGNFRDVSEMRDLIAPKVSSIRNVLKWLLKTFTKEEIIHQTSTSDLLTVKTTIAVAEKLLNCKYYDYTFVSNGKTHRVSRVRMGTDYNVPSSVKNDLYFVSPTHRFPLIRKPKVRKLSKLRDGGELTPTTLRALYNVGNAAGISSSNSQAIASFEDEYYQLSDVQLMWSTYDISPCTITNVPTNEESGIATEAELDVQYITSMGQHIPTQVWLTNGDDFEEDLLEWTVSALQAVANGSSPLLFSVSYGLPEYTFGSSFVTTLNTQFALMGVAGISILFASGDSGAGCNGEVYEPDYPASSPYVTSVGGVVGGAAGEQPLGENAWYMGGGGFSNYVRMQSWQTSAVEYYLANENSLPDGSLYNASGRAFPDIAAQSANFLIYMGGYPYSVSGTSCSAPTSSGIFALLNDLRLQNGMAQLGFLNPFIYQTAEANSTAFNDCISGYNIGCNYNEGFVAAAKWDPVTGYGSPNYEVLAEYVVQTGEETKKWIKK